MGFLSDLKYSLHMLEAMSFHRKGGVDKVNELLNPILDHLVKIAIYIYSKDRDIQVESWGNEVIEWLDQIYSYCSNLKHGNRLKLRDYMLCLSDDLGRESLVRSKINRYSRMHKGKCNRSTDAEQLRLTLWGILEDNFKDMANECWDEFSLLNHPSYIKISQQTEESK